MTSITDLQPIISILSPKYKIYHIEDNEPNHWWLECAHDVKENKVSKKP